MGPESTGDTDGRTRRRLRTRQAIIDAHVDLMLEGDLRPTVDRIAERAGVSRRALWTHFADREELFAAAGEKTLGLQYADADPLPVGAALDERIDWFCRRRVRMLESIAGVARAAQLWLPFSAQVRRNRARHNDRLRSEIERLFAPELDRLGGPDRAELVRALALATSWPAWMGGRDDLGLDVADAGAVLHRTVSALFTAARTPPGTDR